VKKRALTVCQEVSQQLFMINSQTLTRLRAQRVALKDMRLFKKYFTKNESLLIEAALHLVLPT
jgi:hypothetical protein